MQLHKISHYHPFHTPYYRIKLASIGGRRKEEGSSEMQHPFRKLVFECQISSFLILEHNLTV